MTEHLEQTARMPSAVDWFINRTNAGDIDSILDILATGAIVHHDGHALDWYGPGRVPRQRVVPRRVHQPQPVTTTVTEAGEWEVTVTISGSSGALEATRGSVFSFRFSMPGDKIASVRIDRVPEVAVS